MNEINYIGERIWAGQTGHFFIVLSFTAALLSCISFILSHHNKDFLRIARASFYLHGLSVIGIAVMLFVMLFNHYFEYQYVYQHSSRSMDMKYILSCFWEGQEGSFLLWTFWNVILGILLQKQLSSTKWEAPVMATFSIVQVFLASMLLGVFVLDHKIGSNPFLLMREHELFRDIPILKTPDYVSKLEGRGLNPLLMNYWMTIHPPTLFLGFASTLVPFAFALGALWNRDHTGWQKIALPWTFFGILVLGVGILMGGAWAYEALSFGGFWAWDPVENSSLVPWLVLVAAGHTMIINRNKGGSVFTTHLLSLSVFLLVLYSTFLTRSGILGQASVHAFTDLGMTGQLVIYLLTFIFISVALMLHDKLIQVSYVILSMVLFFFSVIYDFQKIAMMSWLLVSFGLIYFSYSKYFPKQKEEEELFSREFWIFLGSLVLLISGLIITYFTSVPVINKLFNVDYAPPKPPVYNNWMMPFAIVLALLMSGGLFLKYKRTPAKDFLKRISYTGVIAVVFGTVCAIPLYVINHEFGWTELSYSLLLITGIFSALANGDYWMNILNGKVAKSGAAIAHIGFALVLVGALVSTSKKTTISANTSPNKVAGMQDDPEQKESIVLTKGDTLPMGPYLVSYREKRREGLNVYFTVDYYKLNKENKPELDFQLTPLIQDNPIMGQAAEPATKHYANRDVYTHVTYADLNVDTSSARAKAYGEAKNYIGHIGDTIFANNALIVIDSLRTNISQEQYAKNDSLLEVTAVLKAIDINSKIYKAYPKYTIRKNDVIPMEAVVEELGLKFVFWKINPEEGSVEITMAERLSNQKDFIVMKAYVFPYINVLWLGCFVMAIGTLISIIERVRKLRRVAS